MKKSRLKFIIFVLWILIGFCIIKLPFFMKDKFSIDTGKMIITCYVIISFLSSSVYNIIKYKYKKNKTT